LEPVVDVVILSWRRAACTVEAVCSVLAQKGVRPQVWIVDQGSGPETLNVLVELVRRSPAVHLTALDRNVGVPAGRNIGIALGSAPVVVGLDNDAVMGDPYVLRHAVSCFDSAPRLGAVAFRILDAATGDDDRSSWVHPRSRSPVESFPAARFCGAAHALRRSAFDECHGYDGALFFYWEETDLCRRLLELGHEIRYVPSLTARHSRSPDARLAWEDGRFYLCVRNRLYLEYCYGAAPGALGLLALGYVLRGWRNHVAGQAVRGVGGALGLAVRRRHERLRTPLSARTRAYLREHEGVHGTGARERARALLARLPDEPGR
jgi:GT2 family glycosyltransferase